MSQADCQRSQVPVSSSAVSSMRQPTCDQDGNIKIKERTLAKRRAETFEVSLKIHGGKTKDSKPAAAGLVNVLETKFSRKTLSSLISRKRKLCTQVFPDIYNKELDAFEGSQENTLCSIATYFSKGVMGKRKYRATYKALSMKKSHLKGSKLERIKVMGCKVPRLLPYNKLIDQVNSIDIGKTVDIREEFCKGLEDCEKVSGCFRPLLQFLPLLASFYLELEKETGEELLWFGEVNTFQVVLGGDGAPFGKEDTACAWLVSFLNRGKHVLSSNENFMIFGANCSEDAVVVRHYVSYLFKEISVMEKQSFSISDREIKFKFSEFPNDLKMLAFLAGELSVSARFFSTFANVSTGDYDNPKGTFGKGNQHKWQPWHYSRRLKVSKEVKKIKEKVERQNISAKTKRKKVTDFIASQKSRQEFEPLIGGFIDRVHVEPLHPKNNACQQLFKEILYESIGKSGLPATVIQFDAVPVASPFKKLVHSLEKKGLTRLSNRVKRWFNETSGAGVDFQYRFTGQDSRLFLKNFMHLIDALKKSSDSAHQTFLLHVFAYTGIQLRQSVSLFCRVVNVNSQDLVSLKNSCLNFFRAKALFSTVTPTTWTFGHIIPAHAQDVFEKYNLGLNSVSMEGREAKHIAISRYSQNTNFHGRWSQIFRYEFVQLIWLRAKGFFVEENNAYKETYIPVGVSSGETCFCGFDLLQNNQKCIYCLHKYRKEIETSVLLGEVSKDIKSLL